MCFGGSAVKVPNSRSITLRISEPDTTSSTFHALVFPTSMYSMNLNETPRSRHARASGTIWSSFTPFRITAFTLTKRPMFFAASMPSRIKPGVNCFVSDMAWNVASFMASRLTVTLSKPASWSALACALSKAPLVVRAMSSSGPLSRSMEISSGRSLRNRGSPPVSLTLRSPQESSEDTTKQISS